MKAIGSEKVKIKITELLNKDKERRDFEDFLTDEL
jgi:hypothetical protein